MPWSRPWSRRGGITCRPRGRSGSHECRPRSRQVHNRRRLAHPRPKNRAATLADPPTDRLACCAPPPAGGASSKSCSRPATTLCGSRQCATPSERPRIGAYRFPSATPSKATRSSRAARHSSRPRKSENGCLAFRIELNAVAGIEGDRPRCWSWCAAVEGEVVCPLFGEFGGALALPVHLILSSRIGGSGEVSVGRGDGEIGRRVAARRDPSGVEPAGPGAGQFIDEVFVYARR
jgi:hypothetical protein